MSQVVPYSDEYRTRWCEYVAGSSESLISHDIRWLDVMRDGLGHKPRYLLAQDGENITGILPLALVRTWWGKKYLVSLPWIDYSGVLADDLSVGKALVDAAGRMAADEGADFLELRTETASYPELAERTDKVTFLLELNEDPDVVWKGFGAKLRNQIRKSDKSGLTTEYGGVERLDDFYSVFAYNMRDLGTPVWSREHFRLILTLLADSSKLILVKLNERVVAAGLLLWHKGRYYVPSASSYRDAIKMCPNHALYWRVIKDACEQGGELFDFGRSSWDSNTFKFKKQWSPEPVQLTWQYYLNRAEEVPIINPTNPKYRLFISMWKKLPLGIANAIGPKVMRNFP